MGANYKILMHRNNGTDYDNLYPISTELTTVFNGYATPQQYGAVADGSRDDSQAIQDALDSGKIVILEGTFLIDNVVTLPADAYLIGQDCVLVPSYDSDGLPKTMFSGTDVNNIIFQNVKFQGSYSQDSSDDNLYAPSLIDITGGDNVIFENCLFKDINGILCNQYDDATASESFWKQNGAVITCRGIKNTKIIGCVLDHASRNSAIWILPLPDAITDARGSLSNIHADICDVQCLGFSESNPPISVLCESATINNIYYDSNCSGYTPLASSALYLFAYHLNVDNINCLGDYEYIINCDGLGMFENDDVNISNVNINNTSSVAISTICKSCNISNLSGFMNCATLVHNIVNNAWSTTFFPWKYTTLGSPTINVSNSNIQSYDGDHAIFMIEGNLGGSNPIHNGSIYIVNSNIKIVQPNTSYQPFTLYGGSLYMSNCNVYGTCSRMETTNMDFSRNAQDVLYSGEYIVYYGGISTTPDIVAITNNAIQVSNCIFDRQSENNVLYLCRINGCIKCVNINNNKLEKLGAYPIVVGNYSDSIIVHNNYTGRQKLSCIIGYRQCKMDYPVFLGAKSIGDLGVISNNPQYYKSYNINCNNSFPIASVYAASNTSSEIIGDRMYYYGAYVIIYNSYNSTTGLASVFASTEDEPNIGSFISRDGTGGQKIIAICVANDWDSDHYTLKSMNSQTLNGTYMGYDTN